jgi:hypothetical protein
MFLNFPISHAEHKGGVPENPGPHELRVFCVRIRGQHESVRITMNKTILLFMVRFSNESI